jgi:hypothetical protein
MKDDMMTEIAPSITEAHCEEVGKMAVCLYYLSSQARAANLPEMAQIINQSISGVVTLGVKRYQELLHQALAKNSNDESVFIENFCKVNDETVKFGIREIFYQRDNN